jgi:hypothetical protein
MSGGSLDYAFIKVQTIIEQLENELITHPKEREALDHLIHTLEVSSEGLKTFEWWLSGDTDSKPFLEWAKKHEV